MLPQMSMDDYKDIILYKSTKPIFQWALYFPGYREILKWWRRREFNSLSNLSIILDYFLATIRDTPNNYPQNAGCGKTALDKFGLNRTSSTLFYPIFAVCAQPSEVAMPLKFPLRFMRTVLFGPCEAGRNVLWENGTYS